MVTGWVGDRVGGWGCQGGGWGCQGGCQGDQEQEQGVSGSLIRNKNRGCQGHRSVTRTGSR